MPLREVIMPFLVRQDENVSPPRFVKITCPIEMHSVAREAQSCGR